jgi:hypothetical protein
MKRIALVALVLAACGGSYKAPPSVPSIALPSGAALLPFDPTKPGQARPAGMDAFSGKVYVALQNYDDSYIVRGPGLLGVMTPTTGHVDIINLGTADGSRCLYPFYVRDDGSKLYVSCTGDIFGTGKGSSLLEADPGTGNVTRSVKTAIGPSGFAITPGKIWFGDSQSGNVYALDRGTFTVTAGPLHIPCPSTGTFQTTNDVISVGGDLYAACSNSTGGILSRLDANTGAVKMQAQVGPNAAAFAQTGDGRIAVVSGTDNKLRLVSISSGALTVVEAYTFGSQTSVLNDVHARDNFLFTVATGSNTVQKLDLTKSGAQILVGEANVGTSASPYSILPLDDDQALVANQMSNTVVSVSSDCTGGKVCWAKPL